MAQKVRIPTVLRKFTNDSAVLELKAGTVKELLSQLGSQYPALAEQLLDNSGGVRRFVNLYVNADDIRSLQNLDTPLKDGDEISIIPAIAGG